MGGETSHALELEEPGGSTITSIGSIRLIGPIVHTGNWKNTSCTMNQLDKESANRGGRGCKTLPKA